jgi:hypothetical protein
MRERIGAQYSALDDLMEFVDEACDDASCRTTVYPNRESAVEQLRLCASEIQSYLHSQQANKQLDTTYSIAEQEIAVFVNKHSIKTDALRLVSGIWPTYENRFNGRVPPGYEDGAKQENAFGDLIFWQEILEHAKDSSAVVILSNDTKSDWRHYAPIIETYRGSQIGHEPRIGAVAQFPHPLLSFEALAAGIVHLDVISISILASLLELSAHNSAPLLLAAAFPRKVEAKPSPDWAALGIDRASLEPVQLIDISVDALREYEPSERFTELLIALKGTLQIRREALLDGALPALLSEQNAVGLARFGQAVFESSSETAGGVSMTDALTLASTLSLEARSAVLLGMLLGIYFTFDCNARSTPVGGTGQSVLTIALREPTKKVPQQLRGMLRLGDVWVLAVPPWREKSLPITFVLIAEDGTVSKRLDSILLNGVELLDSSSSEQRRISSLVQSARATLLELLRIVAVEFAIPEPALMLEQDPNTLVHWDEALGLGLLRMDRKRVMTDIELTMEDGD